MDNKTYKIIGINTNTNRQEKKRIYTSEKDYKKYKDVLIKRYLNYLDVKCYELVDDKWKLIQYKQKNQK